MLCTYCKLPDGSHYSDCPHEELPGSLEQQLLDVRGTIASQSARIAELEANVTHWKTHAKMMAKVADNHKAHEKTLETERDSVRKALAWASKNDVYIESDHVFWARLQTDDDALSFEHDGTPESVEAALLAAAREGGG